MPDRKAFALSRKLLGEEFIADVVKRDEAGESVEEIARTTKMPEMVILAVLRSKSQVDTGGGVD